MKSRLSERTARSAAIALMAVVIPSGREALAQTPDPKPTVTPAASASPSPSASPANAQTANTKVAGQDVPVPARRKYVAPEYPPEAFAQGIRGIVIVEVLIGEDGRVENVRAVRSIPGLDEAAIAAVRLWEYEPSKVSGKPVKVLHQQPITFAMRLPDLQRMPGIPELRAGGPPPIPAGLAKAETAAVAVTLGPQGEVREASVVDGTPAISESLLRTVKAWRFVFDGASPPSFTIRADWAPGPPPALVLKAIDLKTSAAAVASATPPPPAVGTAQPSPNAPTPPSPSGVKSPEPPRPQPTLSPAVDTEVLTAPPEPPRREQGVSAVADVILGDNIPDLARGRRPTWPPLARLGNISGDVVVRFSVDLAGKVTVHSAEGPDMLKAAAEQAVATWTFRRTAIDRLHLIATFKFGMDRSVARVERAPADPK
jgi:TonB family protein